MAAQNVDGVATDTHVRPGDLSPVDGFADGRVGGSRAFGAHVALGGEAGQKVRFRGQGGHDHPLGHRLITVCRSSAPGWRKRWTWASIRPGINVVSPRSMVSAPAGWATEEPAATIFSPSTRTSPGVRMRPRLDIEQASGMEDDRVRCRRSLRRGDGQRSNPKQDEEQVSEWPRWFAEYQ